MIQVSPDLFPMIAAVTDTDNIGDLLVKIATAVGIILGGIAGWRLKSRNADESELKSLRAENIDIREDNSELRGDLLAMVGWASSVRISLAQQGISTPDPPHLKSQDKANNP